ncbi:hypothetical protein [Neobacillus notoginsengisoli]|uniref:hypothetical protein n=1 Tax=Neobacillus notoginsengisoli TaxID=1578198 RepID=UPI0013149A77|nr:hypothetical protein [Neobacillus notoginsengisoli]
MKKPLVLVAVATILLYSFIFLPYENPEKFEGFPVPRFAKVATEKNMVTTYDWSHASEENGLPFTYLLRIKLAGWKAVTREGAMTVYSKNGREIEVTSLTDYLGVAERESE